MKNHRSQITEKEIITAHSKVVAVVVGFSEDRMMDNHRQFYGLRLFFAVFFPSTVVPSTRIEVDYRAGCSTPMDNEQCAYHTVYR